MSPRTIAIIGGAGRTLITLGVLTLAFAGFQLWGTGITEDRAQASLENDFAARRAAFTDFAAAQGVDPGAVGQHTETPSATEPTDGPDPSATEPEPADDVDSVQDATPVQVPDEPPTPAEPVPEELLPSVGEALGVIRIPAIGVDKVVIAGTRRSDLRKGPGHYLKTPLPGQAGNAAIAGHRTTYGAPFGDLDLLEPGDRIVVETFQGLFNYEVLPQTTDEGTAGHSIISPYDVFVLDDYGDNRLTLTACHPKYSARQRIVVQAKLVNPPAATIQLAGLDDALAAELAGQQLAYEATGEDPGSGAEGSDPGRSEEASTVGVSAEALDESLGWHFEEAVPFLVWSLFTALAALITAIAGRKWRKWPSYALATPVVLTLLFLSFTHLDRMLPAF
ncbi:MAG: sortase [Acidimicrobiales bacterium]|nr:sortase [Acidimicrobiales bacterium]